MDQPPSPYKIALTLAKIDGTVGALSMGAESPTVVGCGRGSLDQNDDDRFLAT